MKDIFISYSHQDSEYAHRLAKSLDQAGFAVWFDKRIGIGATWPKEIQEKLDGCSVFIVVMTSNAYKSEWVQNELSRAQRKHKEVFPLLLKGDIWLSVEATQYEDVRNGALPPSSFYRKLAEVLPVQKDDERRRDVDKVGGKPQPARTDLLVIDQLLRLKLVRVPAGEFLMGSDPAKDKGAYDNEEPLHRLTLPEFFIGKYPVTNEQYAVFVQQTTHKAPGYFVEGKSPSGKEKHPVVEVSWHEARAFCQWLSEATGTSYRLPSEAEWEKAARGVDGRLYPWGDQPPSAELCNYVGAMIGSTTPVTRYRNGASPYGSLNMAGNVLEWTRSLFRAYPYDPADGREKVSSSGERVVRGGSYRHSAELARCAYRYNVVPGIREPDQGFRVCVVTEPG